MKIRGLRKRRTQEFICIACPLGCTLTVRSKRGELTSVTGNRCRRGIGYAEQELKGPRRTVTTTVSVEGAPIVLLPVKTSAPVPRDTARDVVRAASRIVVRAPVRIGQVVLADVSGTGASLVATRSCRALEAAEEGES